jgi:hypothetical protein
MVVRDVRVEQSSQVPFVEDDDVVETLASDRPDDPLDIGILPGRPRRRVHDPQAEGNDRAVERAFEDCIVVVQQEARRRDVFSRKRFAELLAGLRPRRARNEPESYPEAAPDAPRMRRLAPLRPNWQLGSRRLLRSFGDLAFLKRLLICGLGVRFPPGSPLLHKDLARFPRPRSFALVARGLQMVARHPANQRPSTPTIRATSARRRAA